MNYKMKYSAAVIAAGVLLGGLGLNGQVIDASAFKSGVKAAISTQQTSKTEAALEWNGKSLSQKGMLDHGTVYVPATAIRDALGIPLKYDAKNKEYTLGNGYNKLIAKVYDANEIYLSVNRFYAGEPGGKIVNGRLYIPYKVLNQYMGIQGQWSPSAKWLSMKPKKQNPITIKTETVKKKISNTTAVVNYPVISGLENEEVQTNINKVLKMNAEETIAGFEQNTGGLSPSGKDYPYEFQGEFVVNYNAQGLLSITTYSYSFTGGAHGMTFRKSFTFSLEDGKQMKLGDFVNMQGTNKQKLNNLVLNKMKKDGGYLGGFKGVPADADFYLKDNAAVLYFQLYDYTAYAYGFPEFELKLKDWK
ncbi:PdaC/SigV domain-containing protein [Paenibacillus sp. GCM10028914]|uniref:PdaC/SigV domain-containing protein n=1 Tax=Paenibacillus sp. GCM10028914 TaxID=3273416 RepID=UPI00362321A9